MGTFLVGAVTAATGVASYGVLSIGVLLVVGLALLLTLPEARGAAPGGGEPRADA